MSPGRRYQVRIYERCGHTVHRWRTISRARLFPQIPMEDKPLPAAATHLLVTKFYHYRRIEVGLDNPLPNARGSEWGAQFHQTENCRRTRFAESIQSPYGVSCRCRSECHDRLLPVSTVNDTKQRNSAKQRWP
jgi:hypothetical protein